MKNIALYNEMIKAYNALSYTHEYIFGFTDRGNVYMCHATAEILPYILTMDKASSKCGGGYSLRFKPTKAQKEVLKTCECKVLCSEAYFNEVFNSCKYNRGEVFEMLVTEAYGQEWKKDNVKFTDGGDIEVNGVAYQIKYNKATFVSEATLRNILAHGE